MMIFYALMLIPLLCGMWWLFLGLIQGPYGHARYNPDWAQATFGLLTIVSVIAFCLYVEANA
jgi:hypothetical protein